MLFYVGTYTRLGGPGIAICSLDSKITRLNATVLPNPTYVILSADQQMLYAVSSDAVDQSEGGSYAAYAIERTGLAELQRYNTGAAGPCHLCLSPDQRFLYTANYSSGTLTVFPLDPPGERIQLIYHQGSSIHPTRQEGPHVHHVSFLPGTNILAAVDLGLDAVVLYGQDRQSGLLTETSRLKCPAGMGPRHLVYGNDNIAWLVHELGNAVSTLKWSADGFQIIQTVTTLPEGWTGENTCAAIRTDGQHVFASNRGHDSIATYCIETGGLLRPSGIYPTGGQLPRDFVLLPDGRFIVGHQGGTVAVLNWDSKSESLQPSGLSLALPGAVCICPVL
jgi:6-phosphogluconolactonase